MSDLVRLVGFFDFHYPLSIPAIWSARKPVTQQTPVLNFLADFKPHVLLFGGDQLHLDCISHWNLGKIRLVEGKRLVTDYDGFNAFLDRADKIVDKSATTKVMLTGNHEAWIDDAIDENPQALEGVIEWPKNLHTDTRGYQVIPRRKVYKQGKMHFAHGDIREGYQPKFYADSIANLYRISIFFGHYHSAQSAIRTSPVDSHSTIAQGVPCLCSTNPDWMKNKPSAFSNGFLVAEIHPDGLFNHQIIQISKGRFAYHGQLYS